MIVPMKHLTLLCVAGESGKALEALRELGCVHVDLSRGGSAAYAEAKGELERAADAVRTVQKAKREAPPQAGAAAVRRTVEDVRQIAAEREKAVSEAEELRRQVAFYEPYGDFDPELARDLIARGIDLSKVCELPDPLPKKRLSEMRRMLAEAEAKAAECTAALATTDETWITARSPELKDRVAFEAARDALETQGAVSWIEGWVPVESVPRLRAKAVTKAWGLLVRGVRTISNTCWLLTQQRRRWSGSCLSSTSTNSLHSLSTLTMCTWLTCFKSSTALRQSSMGDSFSTT